LDMVFLVTPETEEIRIRKLDHLSTGFIYAVSSSSTTGSSVKGSDQNKYFEKLRSMKLKNPFLIGFGIKDKASFSNACSFASGAIIGTAFIKVLENVSDSDILTKTKNFIHSLK
jgi:tryptophan synthase alpha chain